MLTNFYIVRICYKGERLKKNRPKAYVETLTYYYLAFPPCLFRFFCYFTGVGLGRGPKQNSGLLTEWKANARKKFSSDLSNSTYPGLSVSTHSDCLVFLSGLIIRAHAHSLSTRKRIESGPSKRNYVSELICHVFWRSARKVWFSGLNFKSFRIRHLQVCFIYFQVFIDGKGKGKQGGDMQNASHIFSLVCETLICLAIGGLIGLFVLAYFDAL